MTLTKDDLESLIAKQETICVSIFLPAHGGRPHNHEDVVRLKNLLRQAMRELESRKVPEEDASKLLEPARQLVEKDLLPARGTRGIALFLSKDFYRQLNAPVEFSEQVVVAPRFYIRPLLPLIEGRDLFYILALSQNHVRLFEGDRSTVRDLIVERMPANLRDVLRDGELEKQLEFHMASAGHGKRAVIYHGGGDEPKDRIVRFFREVDRTVSASLENEVAPLVLATVDYLFPLYRQVNTYPHLLDRSVSGNPDLLSPAELRAKAWALVEDFLASQRERALVEYRELSGAGVTSSDLPDVIRAACAGRVRVLLAPPAGEKIARGAGRAREELLNLAVSQTLLHGGTAYEIPSGAMPGGAPVAALYRY